MNRFVCVDTAGNVPLEASDLGMKLLSSGIAEPLVGSGKTDGDKITLFGNEVDHDDVEKIILRATWSEYF